MAATEPSMPPTTMPRVIGTTVLSTPWPGLAVAARAAGVELGSGQLACFDRYRDLLLQWNDRFNLTAVTDPDAIEQRLFLDAVRLLPALDRFALTIVPSGGRSIRVVDIGAGAGFPGLPIAICRPDFTVTLVEATGKKVTFLDTVAAELDLPNVRAIHARAEEIGRESAHRGAYDLATARAVASLPALLELSMPLLRVGGVALFPKGQELSEELAGARRAAPLVGAALLADDPLPGGETCLIVARKEAVTPARYPRRSGIPAREPLGMFRPRQRAAADPRDTGS